MPQNIQAPQSGHNLQYVLPQTVTPLMAKSMSLGHWPEDYPTGSPTTAPYLRQKSLAVLRDIPLRLKEMKVSHSRDCVCTQTYTVCGQLEKRLRP
jgi:hypothetical protein